jgi:hypothetical protein
MGPRVAITPDSRSEDFADPGGSGARRDDFAIHEAIILAIMEINAYSA